MEKHTCAACNKSYVDIYGLRAHLKRQPLCEKWMSLKADIKDYVDDKFMLPMSDLDQADKMKCGICGARYSTVGNLNKHLDSSVICSKWAMYKDLQPLESYMPKFNSLHAPVPASEVPACLHHIIWNVFIADKETMMRPEFKTELENNNVKYIVAVLPQGEPVISILESLEAVQSSVMYYRGHDPIVDLEQFEKQCSEIEDRRVRRENCLVFCNNGYQRSIPFLCYYLTVHHKDEVPDISRAIDIILPQVDKRNYATLRDPYIKSMRSILHES